MGFILKKRFCHTVSQVNADIARIRLATAMYAKTQYVTFRRKQAIDWTASIFNDRLGKAALLPKKG